MSTSVSYRKSTVPTGTSLNGNGAKYLSYREAWARIKLARRQGFFLEAVTIGRKHHLGPASVLPGKGLRPDTQGRHQGQPQPDRSEVAHRSRGQA
jgi:hypothetical protein